MHDHIDETPPLEDLDEGAPGPGDHDAPSDDDWDDGDWDDEGEDGEDERGVRLRLDTVDDPVQHLLRRLFIKEIVSDTVSGTPTIDGNGNISFDAPSNRSTQTITYRIEDANGLTDTATVTILTDRDGDLNGFISGSGDLGNNGNEIFGMDEG